MYKMSAEARTIACDESGSEGENLVASQRPTRTASTASHETSAASRSYGFRYRARLTPSPGCPCSDRSGHPPSFFGLDGDSLTVVCTGYVLTDDRVNTTTTQSRRHVTVQQAHQKAELIAWRDDAARRIRDAMAARTTLLDTVPV